jgi:hypothetical protein
MTVGRKIAVDSMVSTLSGNIGVIKFGEAGEAFYKFVLQKDGCHVVMDRVSR